MADQYERVAGDLKICIDPTLCVAFGDCIGASPEAFMLDANGMVAFVAPERVARETLLAACDACPVDAITVWDADGRRLVP
jgi:ferredoxin